MQNQFFSPPAMHRHAVLCVVWHVKTRIDKNNRPQLFAAMAPQGTVEHHDCNTVIIIIMHHGSKVTVSVLCIKLHYEPQPNYSPQHHASHSECHAKVA